MVVLNKGRCNSLATHNKVVGSSVVVMVGGHGGGTGGQCRGFECNYPPVHNSQVPPAPTASFASALALAPADNEERNNVTAYYEDFGEMDDRSPTVSQTACTAII